MYGVVLDILHMVMTINGISGRVPLSHEHQIWKLSPRADVKASSVIIKTASIKCQNDANHLYQVLKNFQSTPVKHIEFKVSRKVTISPGMKSRIPVKSSSDADVEIVIEPSSESLDRLVIPEHQVTSSLTDSIFVSNFNSFPVTLTKNTLLALGSEIVEKTSWNCLVPNSVEIALSDPIVTTVMDLEEEEMSLNYLKAHFNQLIVQDIFNLVENKPIPSYPVSFQSRRTQLAKD